MVSPTRLLYYNASLAASLGDYLYLLLVSWNLHVPQYERHPTLLSICMVLVEYFYCVQLSLICTCDQQTIVLHVEHNHLLAHSRTAVLCAKMVLTICAVEI